MGKKKSMPSFETVDDYIESQPEDAQVILKKLRSLIKEAVPETVEIPNSKVPTFTLVQGVKSEKQIMIAAYAKQVSFYPFEATIDHFSNELKSYDLGKGTVKFSFNKPLPGNLIKEMVLFRKEEVLSQAS